MKNNFAASIKALTNQKITIVISETQIDSTKNDKTLSSVSIQGILEFSTLGYVKYLEICSFVCNRGDMYYTVSRPAAIKELNTAITGKLQGRITTQGDPCSHYRE